MMRILSKLICRFRGHLRGRKVNISYPGAQLNIIVLRCPRCGAQWSRRYHKPKEKA